MYKSVKSAVESRTIQTDIALSSIRVATITLSRYCHTGSAEVVSSAKDLSDIRKMETRLKGKQFIGK